MLRAGCMKRMGSFQHVCLSGMDWAGWRSVWQTVRIRIVSKYPMRIGNIYVRT